MISRTNKSLVWLWMAALLSASIGVSIKQVYCYCVGKTTVSLFSSADACQAEKMAAISSDCCSVEKAPKKTSCCDKPDKEDSGCTKKTTQVFQLKTEFEVSNSDFKKLDTPKTWAIPPAFQFIIERVKNFLGTDCCSFERPPPSTLSGRMICVRYGIFRC